jgi:hypothetical protein
MLGEVCKHVRDQDHDGEFFDSIEDNEDLVEEQIHEESFQEKEDHYEDEALVFSHPFDEDIQSSIHQKGNMASIILLKTLMMLYSMILEMNKVAKRISMKFLLQKY